MPLYTFECESCGLQFDDSRSVDDRSPSTCRCGGVAVRLISAPAHVICKGGDGELLTKSLLEQKAKMASDLFGLKTISPQVKMRAYAEEIAEGKAIAAAGKGSGAKIRLKHRIPREVFHQARHQHGKAVLGAEGLDYWNNEGFSVEK